MKTIEKMIAVMQAFKDGKEIEFCDNSLSTCTWYSTDAPSWDWYGCDYRVKQELKLKYRPYANADECFADVKKHGSWVKNQRGQYINIVFIENCSISYASDKSILYEYAYSHLVWADDGSVFGMLEEE